ncbi:N-acetylglucosamine-6-phosphate deacetylase [uncultured Aeromicrobium sp.]|uniref:N-acetylglucosamine-6-phosphate deacetylase n=1 Tax=uncultured Aeromicrobium sp. TaxID=337820 RepID=UPI0025D13F7F|nr:N-acetylglucosamine-6-phosphate deacetylase [uncultured Aeromicrobium sp.]
MADAGADSANTQLVRGTLINSTDVIDDGLVEVQAGVITNVRPSAGDTGQLPPHRGVIVPGLVDIHCHGGGGFSFTSGVREEMAAAAQHHRRRGTTSVVASMVTDRSDRMLDAVTTAARAVEEGELAGIHIEGPFLSARRCGAQDTRYLRAPDPGFARELLTAGRGHVRMMTLAPELPEALAVAEVILEHGAIPAVGHTDADAPTARALMLRATEQGRSALATHLFNGMAPLHHRRPGAVGAALELSVRGQGRVELIVDGVHLDDETVRLVHLVCGYDGVVLVSDAMEAAGMPDGTYELGSQMVTVRDRVARLVENGEDVSIAGSTISLVDAVQRAVAHCDIALHDAVRSATSSPAAALGLSAVGDLAPGFRADLVVLDNDLRPLEVMRSGSWLP